MKLSKSVQILVLLLVLAIVLPLFLTCRSLVSADESFFLSVNRLWNSDFADLFTVLSELGSFYFWFIVVFILWIWGKRTLATYLLVGILIHIAVGGPMKYFVDRPRPFEVFPDAFHLFTPSDPSFPSGHSEGSFVAAIALGLRDKRFLVPLSLFAAYVGASRVIIGVHFPYDVFGGAIIGIVAGALAASLDLSKLQARMESGWAKLTSFLLRHHPPNGE